MAEGIQRATGEILVFVDADLIGLEQEHIASIVHPLLRGEADLVIGYPSRGGQAFLDAINVFRSLAGERAVFRKDILPLVTQIRTSRFGVETLINLNYRQEAKRVRYVRLLVIGNVLRTAIALGFVAITLWLDASRLLLISIYASNMAFSAITTVTMSAEGSLIPRIVKPERLLAINSII